MEDESKQDETLAHFQSITGSSDLDECRACLQAHGWDLDAAVNAFFSHNDAAAGPAAASAPSGGGADAMDVDGDGGSGGGSAAGGGGGGGRGQEQQQQQQQVRGPFHAATGIPFWTVATLGLVGGGASGQRPGEHSQFVDRFKREHGEDHPAVAAETFRAAVDIAKSTHRFLVAYIHSPHHENTAEFCKDTLCTPVMQSFIDDNFVFWMDSISSAEGYRVSSMLRVSSYPYVAVVTTTQDGRTAVCDAHQGMVSRDDLMNWLLNIMETQGPQLVAARAEMEERAMDRRLREEQDAAFQQSLLEDQQREREREEELERETLRQSIADAEKAEKEAEEAARAEREAEEERVRVEAKIKKRESFGAEPEVDSGDASSVASIAVRLPDGQRMQRKFEGGEAVGRVYDWVDGFGDMEIGPEGYDLCTSFPKKVLSDREQTISEAGLMPQVMLMIQERD